jgi:hypothetical protein
MRLTWLFATLFVLCGLPLLVTEDPAWQRIWAGVSATCLGAFALAWAHHAVRVGQIKLQFSWIRRASQPRTFWATIFMLLATGTIVVVSGVWILFFKA